MDQNMGKWAFIIGVLIAVLAGLVPAWQTQPWIAWVLVLLGLVVGLLNITARETTEFLVAAIALLLASTAGALPDLGMVVGQILMNIIAFVSPAALLVSLKAIWALEKA